MRRKIRWGVLGVAKIAMQKVIPAMQLGEYCEVTAIASREHGKARNAADELGIAKAYGSYEALLADGEVDAIYNPLPNHLHVPWSIRAAEASKHVLCEKPIALSAEEGRTLIAARDRTGMKMGEAFMVRTHPLWIRVRELVQGGEIGDLRAIISAFSYFDADPSNIRNKLDIGGGALMDVGCYPITMARWLFERQPVHVSSRIDRDPLLGTDRLTSALLDFGTGHAVFTCSTQLSPFQRMEVLGTRGRIDIEIPYNIPPDVPSRILVDDGSQLAGESARIEEFKAANQYTIQGDVFSRAILDNTEVPVTLEDSVANMEVIEAVFSAAAKS